MNTITPRADAATTTRPAPRSGLAAPGRLLRLEGAAVLVAALVAYAHLGTSWWWFIGLLFVPDVGLAGYAAGPRVGAATYNLTHTYLWPLALGTWGLVGESTTALSLAIIWAAHLGMDRALGYGLKYATAFGDTHLHRVV